MLRFERLFGLSERPAIQRTIQSKTGILVYTLYLSILSNASECYRTLYRGTLLKNCAMRGRRRHPGTRQIRKRMRTPFVPLFSSPPALQLHPYSFTSLDTPQLHQHDTHALMVALVSLARERNVEHFFFFFSEAPPLLEDL